MRTWSWTVSLALGGLGIVALIAGAVLIKRQKDALQAEADSAFPEAA